MNDNWHTYQRQLVQPVGLLGAIVIVASALVPTRALPDAAVPQAPIAKVIAPINALGALGALGVIEITGSTAQESCKNDDAKFLADGEYLVRDAAIADAMRARLVREHLSYVAGLGAMLGIEHDERDFAADHAEIRAVRSEVAQEEQELATARCEASEADQAALGLQPSATVEVRIELPRPYLLSLQQALAEGRDAVAVQAGEPLSQHSDVIGRGPLTGPLVSLESMVVNHEAGVIARARLPDALHRLRDGEIVAVEVQLGACTQSEACIE